MKRRCMECGRFVKKTDTRCYHCGSYHLEEVSKRRYTRLEQALLNIVFVVSKGCGLDGKRAGILQV